MWREAFKPMMDGQSADIQQGFLRPAAQDRHAEGHHAPRQRRKNQQRSHMRQAREASNCSNQLYIAGSHPAGKPENKKNKTADKTSASRKAELGPSTKHKMKQ